MIGCHFEAEETLASVSFIKLCIGKKSIAEMLIKHARVAITLPMPLHVHRNFISRFFGVELRCNKLHLDFQIVRKHLSASA